MAVYCITGGMGAGKGIYAAFRALQYYRAGYRVASNYPFDTRLLGADCENNIDVLPVIPDAESLLALGLGSPDDGTERFGAIFLDEALTFLNARDYNNPGRKSFNEWFIHTRKFRWDVYILVQDIDMIDSQIREKLFDYHVCMSRLDRLKIPFISSMMEFIFPKKYGFLSQKKSILPHYVNANTYLKKQQYKAKPVSKETINPRTLYGIYPTGFLFIPGKPFTWLNQDFYPDGGYTLLSGAYITKAIEKYGDKKFYPPSTKGKSKLSALSPVFRFIKKALPFLALVFMGWILWHYWPVFFGGGSPAAATDSPEGSYSGASAGNGSVSSTGSGSQPAAAAPPVPVTPPPPVLSTRWRLVGYLSTPGKSSRFMLRDSSGNVRYVVSDAIYRAQFTEIVVDGEIVTFYSGSASSSDKSSSSSIVDSLAGAANASGGDSGHSGGGSLFSMLPSMPSSSSGAAAASSDSVNSANK